MSINLPQVLTQFLNMVGFQFPEGKETEIIQWAEKWQRFSDAVTQLVETTSKASAMVKQENSGPAVEAFSANFEDSGSPKDVSENLSKAAKITSTCLLVIGAAILVVKILMIVDLSVFAAQFWAAIAAIPATFGASMGWIPPAQLICQKAIGMGIEVAAKKVLG